MANSLLLKVKTALKIATNAYDDELADLIAAAKADLGILGITKAQTDTDPLIRRAIIVYCRMHHGSPDDYDRLAESYRTIKGQLRMATGYTDWGDG